MLQPVIASLILLWFSGTAFTPVAGSAGSFETTTAKWMQVGSIQLNGKISDETIWAPEILPRQTRQCWLDVFIHTILCLQYLPDSVKDACEAGNFSYVGLRHLAW